MTARITPFNPGASPPPASIPTLRTSACATSCSKRAREVSLGKLLLTCSHLLERKLSREWENRSMRREGASFLDGCRGKLVRRP
jgi:hypothetical protein